MAGLFRQSIYSRLAGYEDIPRELFRAILERIRRLNPPEAVPYGKCRYKITVAAAGETLLNQITKVTFRKRHLPQEKNYAEIYEKIPTILDIDLFQKPNDE